MGVGREIGYWAFIAIVFILFWFLPIFRIAIAFEQVEKISVEEQLDDTGGLREDWQHDKYLDLIRSNYSNNQYQKARIVGVYETILTVFQSYMPYRIILSLMYLFGLVPSVGKHICFWTNGGDSERNNNVWAAFLIPAAWYLLAGSTLGAIYIILGFDSRDLMGTGQMDEERTVTIVFLVLFAIIEEIIVVVVVHFVTTKLSKNWIFPILAVIFSIVSFSFVWFLTEADVVGGNTHKAEIAQPEFYRFFLNFIEKHDIDFPKDKIYVTEDYVLNAYFSGMANPRIVIGKPFFMCVPSKENANLVNCPPPTLRITGNNTLSLSDQSPQRKFSNDELMAVLAHELGHWKENHIGKNLGLQQGMLFLGFVISGGVYYSDIISDVFKIPSGRPQIEHIIILNLFLIKPFFQFVATMSSNALTRTGEYEADHFAKELGKSDGLASCLLKLTEMTAQLPDANYLFDWFNRNHPSLVHRLQQL